MAFERSYIIPLRQGTLKSPRSRRAKKAITTIREFIVRHAKSEDMVLGKELNEHIWSQGITNPPGKVHVNVLKEKDGRVFVNLIGSPVKPAN